MPNYRKKSYTRTMVTVSLCAAMLAVSAWLTVPFTVGFTMQSFAVFLITLLFGWHIGALSVAVYIAVGICGVPVFSGFSSGIAAIIGPTGGYLLGFVFIPLVLGALGAILPQARMLKSLAMLVGLVACYMSGTVWYVTVYGGGGAESIWGVLCICVLPFVVPDAIKLALALIISSRLSRHIKRF